MLVVISAIAVVMYQTTPREYTIRPSAGWKTFTTNDQKEGGSSTAIDESTDSEFAYRYEIRQGSVNPYASLIITPTLDDQLLDLRWMETVSITAHIEGLSLIHI